MKRFMSLLLLCILVLAPCALAESSVYVESSTYNLGSCSYLVPATLPTFLSEDNINVHISDEGGHVILYFLPSDDILSFAESDSSFAELCIYMHLNIQSDAPAVGLPLIFPSPAGFVNAALIMSADEVFFYAANSEGLLTIQTSGFLLSQDVQAAFMQIISSLEYASSDK